MLATYSLLPVFQRFAGPMGVTLERRDISVAGRILAAFPECLTAEQRQSDDLAWLGDLAKTPEGMIVKLPNISASVPQLVAAIAELQSQGYKVITHIIYQHPQIIAPRARSTFLFIRFRSTNRTQPRRRRRP